MRPFELFVGGPVPRKLLGLTADEQWQALSAFEAVANHPFTTGLLHWVGEDGHTRYLRAVHGWLITFRIDHAERNIRILDVDRA
jgi:hypothetical protein